MNKRVRHRPVGPDRLEAYATFRRLVGSVSSPHSARRFSHRAISAGLGRV